MNSMKEVMSFRILQGHQRVEEVKRHPTTSKSSAEDSRKGYDMPRPHESFGHT